MARLLQPCSLLIPPNFRKKILHTVTELPKRAMATSALSSPMSLGGESGTRIPRLVYGTAWKKDQTADLVYQSIEAGFRGVDTAAQPRHYQEALVGDGIRRAVEDGIVERKDLFVRLPLRKGLIGFKPLCIQTKYTPPSGQDPQNMPYDPQLSIPDQVHASIASSLKNLSTGNPDIDYLDCVLMHSPFPELEGTATAWKTLSTYVTSGKIHHLGIANVSLPVLVFLASTMDVKPSVVQNRFYAESGYEVQLRRLCREHGMVFQSFWTLTGNPGLLKSEHVKTLASKVGVSVQVALYALVVGLEKVTVLDGTKNRGRMVEDLEGLEKVGLWAEGEGEEEWEQILDAFKDLTGEI